VPYPWLANNRKGSQSLLASAWDYSYRDKDEREVLLDLAGQLYPEHDELVGEAYVALQANEAQQITPMLSRLQALVTQRTAGRPGAPGRKLFPDNMQLIRESVSQSEIRLAQRALIAAAYSEVM